MIFFPLLFLQTEAKPPGKAFLCRADAFLMTGLPPEMKQQELFMKRHKPPLLKARSLAKPTNVFTCNHGSTKCKTFCNISYPLYIHNIHIQHTSVSGLLLPRLVAFGLGFDQTIGARFSWNIQFELRFTSQLRSNNKHGRSSTYCVVLITVFYLTPSTPNKTRSDRIANLLC